MTFQNSESEWMHGWISQGGGNCRSEGAPGETGRGGTFHPAQCQGGARRRQAGKGWLHRLGGNNEHI